MTEQALWYLVATKPKQEQRAAEHLSNQSIEYFLPEIEVEKSLRGKRSVRIEPLFPGYLFVALPKDSVFWSKIRSTRGIRDVIRFAGKPAMVMPDIINHLKSTLGEDDKPLKLSMLPKQGDSVEIKEGPFKGLSAIFQSLDGEERAIILLEILGKQQSLAVNLSDLGKL